MRRATSKRGALKRRGTDPLCKLQVHVQVCQSRINLITYHLDINFEESGDANTFMDLDRDAGPDDLGALPPERETLLASLDCRHRRHRTVPGSQSGLSDANEGYAHNFDKQCSARGPLTRMLTPWTDSQRQPVRLPFYVSFEEDGGRPRDRNWTAKRGKLWT